MEEKVKTAKFTVLLLAIIYAVISIIAIISEFSINSNISTVGKFSFYSFIKTSWWPFLIIILMVLSNILYMKKYRYGAILETATGGIILANTIRNMIGYGTTLLASVLSILLPVILILQGILLINFKDGGAARKLKPKKEKDNITSRKKNRIMR